MKQKLLEMVPFLMLALGLVCMIYVCHEEYLRMAEAFDKHHEACFASLDKVQKQVSRLQNQKDREGYRDIARIIEDVDRKREIKRMNERIDFIQNKTSTWQQIIMDYLFKQAHESRTPASEPSEVSIF